MRKKFLVMLLILLVAVEIWRGWNGVKILCAKKLITATEEQDAEAVDRILRWCPGCVNTYPLFRAEDILNKVCQGVPGEYPLQYACRRGNYNIVKSLVDAGADVNCDLNNHTPLELTYRCKGEDWYPISVYLIDQGASLDYTTILKDILQGRPGGMLPGYVAESDEEVRAAFHAAYDNCDRSIVDWTGVLMTCAFYNRVEILQFLIDQDCCDVNDNTRGKTALMVAAEYSEPEMIRMLLEYGADKEMVDPDNGRTAYDYAVEAGKDENAALLK